MKALKAAREKLYDRSRDDRPPVGKQRADALTLVAESALAGGLEPGQSGDRYQVVVHVNEEELKAPEPTSADHGPHVSAETPSAPQTGSASAEAGGGRVSAETPVNGACSHSAWLGTSSVPVSAETVRRIACEAGRVRMTHRNGEILSVGRKTRTIPPPIRRALEFRDRSCRFPGCTSQHCDAHHVHHWADGGETKLSNLVLLCRRHHRLLHEGGCSVRMNDEGAAQFFDSRGRPLEHCPAPPSMAPTPPRSSSGTWRTQAFCHRQGVHAHLGRQADGPALCHGVPVATAAAPGGRGGSRATGRHQARPTPAASRLRRPHAKPVTQAPWPSGAISPEGGPTSQAPTSPHRGPAPKPAVTPIPQVWTHGRESPQTEEHAQPVRRSR